MIIEREQTIKADDFEGKVVLVTGANRGFGLAITMDLARLTFKNSYAISGTSIQTIDHQA